MVNISGRPPQEAVLFPPAAKPTSKPQTGLLSGALSGCPETFVTSASSAPDETLGDAVKSLGSEWGDPVSASFSPSSLPVSSSLNGNEWSCSLSKEGLKIRAASAGLARNRATGDQRILPCLGLHEVSPPPLLSLCSFSYLAGCCRAVCAAFDSWRHKKFHSSSAKDRRDRVPSPV